MTHPFYKLSFRKARAAFYSRKFRVIIVISKMTDALGAPTHPRSKKIKTASQICPEHKLKTWLRTDWTVMQSLNSPIHWRPFVCEHIQFISQVKARTLSAGLLPLKDMHRWNQIWSPSPRRPLSAHTSVPLPSVYSGAALVSLASPHSTAQKGTKHMRSLHGIPLDDCI